VLFVLLNHPADKKNMATKKGNIPWNKGKKGLQVAWCKGHPGYTTKAKGVPKSVAHREALSKAHKGKPLSELHRQHVNEAHIDGKWGVAGKHHKPEAIEKMRQKRLNRVFPFKDTSIERIMQQALVEEGIAFDKHVPLPGQPDFFIKPDLCIFCDGDYWHHYPTGKENDPKITAELISKGYKVLRFWEHDIHNKLADCLEQIKEIAGCVQARSMLLPS
jgi:G:T-mismatch repair DNA endonuclease (very short patch repair protein)